MQQQTFSTLKCGWRQSWGWLATTRSIQALFAEGREHGRTIPLADFNPAAADATSGAATKPLVLLPQ